MFKFDAKIKKENNYRKIFVLNNDNYIVIYIDYK